MYYLKGSTRNYIYTKEKAIVKPNFLHLNPMHKSPAFVGSSKDDLNLVGSLNPNFRETGPLISIRL